MVTTSSPPSLPPQPPSPTTRARPSEIPRRLRVRLDIPASRSRPQGSRAMRRYASTLLEVNAECPRVRRSEVRSRNSRGGRSPDRHRGVCGDLHFFRHPNRAPRLRAADRTPGRRHGARADRPAMPCCGLSAGPSLDTPSPRYPSFRSARCGDDDPRSAGGTSSRSRQGLKQGGEEEPAPRGRRPAELAGAGGEPAQGGLLGGHLS